MSAASLEVFLARLYADAALLQRFLADRTGEARKAGLDDAEVAAMEQADGIGLRMAAHSYAHKRTGRRSRRAPSLFSRLARWLRPDVD